MLITAGPSCCTSLEKSVTIPREARLCVDGVVPEGITPGGGASEVDWAMQPEDIDTTQTLHDQQTLRLPRFHESAPSDADATSTT